VILAEIAVCGNPDGSGVVEAGSASGPDGGSAAVVLVVGGGVAETFVEPDGVVEPPSAVQLELQLASVCDLVQVRVLAREMAEERLDPGLVVRGAGPPEVGGDPGTGQDALVEREVICGPVSDSTSSTGSSSWSGTSPRASSA